jgi:hypothetical protein
MPLFLLLPLFLLPVTSAQHAAAAYALPSVRLIWWTMLTLVGKQSASRLAA